MTEPIRAWWARPRKLCALERPGGGGRSHRPERREAEIAWLKEHGVRTVVSTMATRHNLPAYEAAGLESHHVAVPSTAGADDALDEWWCSCAGCCGRGEPSRSTATGTPTSSPPSAPRISTSTAGPLRRMGCGPHGRRG